MIAIAALSAGCDDSDRVPTAAFDDLFDAADTVILAEPDSAPITGIRDFVPTEDGRFVLIDRARPEVRLYASNGQLMRTVGRFGDGPGEFRNPMAAAVDNDGQLLVADSGSDLLTRFTSDMAYDTAFPMPGLLVRALLAELFLSAGGRRRHDHREGNNLFYPFRMYDASGDLLRKFGTPPPFWKDATHPDPGAFMGVDGFARMEAWLSALTLVSSVGIYRDSAVVVVHAEPEPQPTDIYARSDISLDLYDVGGTKLWEDVRVPGRVLRTGRFLYVLEREPLHPEAPFLCQRRASS